MSFTKKTWKDRKTEYPNRRLPTKEDGSTELVTVSREEGTISAEGDAFSAENMNDLEGRISDTFGGLSFAQDAEGNWGYKPSGADTVIPFRSGESGGDVTIKGVYTLEDTSGIQTFTRTFDIGTDEYDGFTTTKHMYAFIYNVRSGSATNVGVHNATISGSTLTLVLNVNSNADGALNFELTISLIEPEADEIIQL